MNKLTSIMLFCFLLLQSVNVIKSAATHSHKQNPADVIYLDGPAPIELKAGPKSANYVSSNQPSYHAGYDNQNNQNQKQNNREVLSRYVVTTGAPATIQTVYESSSASPLSQIHSSADHSNQYKSGYNSNLNSAPLTVTIQPSQNYNNIQHQSNQHQLNQHQSNQHQSNQHNQNLGTSARYTYGASPVTHNVYEATTINPGYQVSSTSSYGSSSQASASKSSSSAQYQTSTASPVYQQHTILLPGVHSTPLSSVSTTYNHNNNNNDNKGYYQTQQNNHNGGGSGYISSQQTVDPSSQYVFATSTVSPEFQSSSTFDSSSSSASQSSSSHFSSQSTTANPLLLQQQTAITPVIPPQILPTSDHQQTHQIVHHQPKPLVANVAMSVTPAPYTISVPSPQYTNTESTVYHQPQAIQHITPAPVPVYYQPPTIQHITPAPVPVYHQPPTIQHITPAPVPVYHPPPAVHHIPVVTEVPVTHVQEHHGVIHKTINVAQPGIKTKTYEIRRPAIQKQFYDVEERVIVKPAGSVVVEIDQPISKTATGESTSHDHSFNAHNGIVYTGSHDQTNNFANHVFGSSNCYQQGHQYSTNENNDVHYAGSAAITQKPNPAASIITTALNPIHVPDDSVVINANHNDKYVDSSIQATTISPISTTDSSEEAPIQAANIQQMHYSQNNDNLHGQLNPVPHMLAKGEPDFKYPPFVEIKSNGEPLSQNKPIVQISPTHPRSDLHNSGAFTLYTMQSVMDNGLYNQNNQQSLSSAYTQPQHDLQYNLNNNHNAVAYNQNVQQNQNSAYTQSEQNNVHSSQQVQHVPQNIQQTSPLLIYAVNPNTHSAQVSQPHHSLPYRVYNQGGVAHSPQAYSFSFHNQQIPVSQGHNQAYVQVAPQVHNSGQNHDSTQVHSNGHIQNNVGVPNSAYVQYQPQSYQLHPQNHGAAYSQAPYQNNNHQSAQYNNHPSQAQFYSLPNQQIYVPQILTHNNNQHPIVNHSNIVVSYNEENNYNSSNESHQNQQILVSASTPQPQIVAVSQPKLCDHNDGYTHFPQQQQQIHSQEFAASTQIPQIVPLNSQNSNHQSQFPQHQINDNQEFAASTQNPQILHLNSQNNLNHHPQNNNFQAYNQQQNPQFINKNQENQYQQISASTQNPQVINSPLVHQTHNPNNLNQYQQSSASNYNPQIISKPNFNQQQPYNQQYQQSYNPQIINNPNLNHQQQFNPNNQHQQTSAAIQYPLVFINPNQNQQQHNQNPQIIANQNLVQQQNYNPNLVQQQNYNPNQNLQPLKGQIIYVTQPQNLNHQSNQQDLNKNQQQNYNPNVNQQFSNPQMDNKNINQDHIDHINDLPDQNSNFDENQQGFTNNDSDNIQQSNNDDVQNSNDNKTVIYQNKFLVIERNNGESNSSNNNDQEQQFASSTQNPQIINQNSTHNEKIRGDVPPLQDAQTSATNSYYYTTNPNSNPATSQQAHNDLLQYIFSSTPAQHQTQHSSNQGNYGFDPVHTRVVSASPASKSAEPTGQRTHTRRIVVNQPIETVQVVQEQEPVTNYHQVTVQQPTVYKTQSVGVKRVQTSVPVLVPQAPIVPVVHTNIPVVNTHIPVHQPTYAVHQPAYAVHQPAYAVHQPVHQSEIPIHQSTVPVHQPGYSVQY